MKIIIVIVAILVGGYALLPVVSQMWFTNALKSAMVESIKNGELKNEMLYEYGDNARFKVALTKHYDDCTAEPLVIAEKLDDADEIEMFEISFDIYSSVVKCVAYESGGSFALILRQLREDRRSIRAEMS